MLQNVSHHTDNVNLLLLHCLPCPGRPLPLAHTSHSSVVASVAVVLSKQLLALLHQQETCKRSAADVFVGLGG
jgi:hypothetical protein